MDFPCTICGACCRNISGVKELAPFDLGNGVCRHLDTATQKCLIYDNRPQICRVDKMYEKVFCQHYSLEEFYTLNLKACQKLQEKEGVDEALRIKT
ncbi:YkgJ family cysteine cluster protein [Helicobacter ailurogastricus]|uniref:YkgJ family cysteine cluster protein n=1 Tax=Helicobacter ailurogastricus TaxID=1578720 RepID=UPI000CF01B8A|nr:YkgJ family cysteine cluster protein [Helicobacter ailurogastricus]